MADKSLGVIVIVAAIVVFGWLVPLVTWGSVTIGDTTYRGVAPANAVSLIGATATTTDGYYDSLDRPLTTTYAVPTGRTLTLVRADVASTSTRTVLQIGYGDTHVENSAAAPTNPVTLYETNLPAAATYHQIPVELAMPAGKFPWMRTIGAVGQRAVLVGIER